MRIKRFGKMLGICLLVGISSGCGNDSSDDGKESGAPVVIGEPNIAEIDFAIESKEDSTDSQPFIEESSYKGSEQLPEEITKQIAIYVSEREAWLPEFWKYMEDYQYTWNDLNLDGSLELICSSCEGTGWYSYSYVYAINSAREVECVAEIGGEFANPDLLWGLELYADVPKEGQNPELFYICAGDFEHDNRYFLCADIVISFTAELTEWQKEWIRSKAEEYGGESVEYWVPGGETISKEEWEHLEEEFLKDKELITADFAWDRLWPYSRGEMTEITLSDKELGEALEALYISWQELEPGNAQENELSENNDTESVAPFIDEELYLYIKGVYEAIDWDIQFLPGDESKYDLYREQFIKLLKEEIPVVDDKGYEKTLSHFGEIEMDTNESNYDPNQYNYYFFDVDGDGTPELGLTNNQRFVYIFKYEEETDRIVLWDEYIGGMNLMGTEKFYWSGPNGDWGMMGLDQNGDYIYLASFKVKGNPDYYNDEDDVWAFYVALPDYVAIEEWMLKQAAYLDSAYPYYCFRLTEEQYDELHGRLTEASHKSHKEKEEVTYTYEELLNLKSDIVYATEAEEYRILTKRYVRRPDGYHVLIEWPKITGAGNQQAYDNINYILERNVFRIVDYFILYPEESGHVLQRIANMKDQDLTISYKVLYQDDQILCIYIREQSTYYWEDGGFWAYSDEDYYYVFDVNTGKQLELSDFIEIDRRIVDYVAEDYQPTNYNSAANEPSYSFMDAFEVYEDEKYEHHEVMNVEEALEALKDGTIQWYIVDDKILVLQWKKYKCTFQDVAWVEIPYSYIEEFAYY